MLECSRMTQLSDRVHSSSLPPCPTMSRLSSFTPSRQRSKMGRTVLMAMLVMFVSIHLVCGQPITKLRGPLSQVDIDKASEYLFGGAASGDGSGERIPGNGLTHADDEDYDGAEGSGDDLEGSGHGRTDPGTNEIDSSTRTDSAGRQKTSSQETTVTASSTHTYSVNVCLQLVMAILVATVPWSKLM